MRSGVRGACRRSLWSRRASGWKTTGNTGKERSRGWTRCSMKCRILKKAGKHGNKSILQLPVRSTEKRRIGRRKAGSEEIDDEKHRNFAGKHARRPRDCHDPGFRGATATGF